MVISLCCQYNCGVFEANRTYGLHYIATLICEVKFLYCPSVGCCLPATDIKGCFS